MNTICCETQPCAYLQAISEQRAEIERLRATLTDIREKAATMNNGGSWAAGRAAIALAYVHQQSTPTKTGE